MSKVEEINQSLTSFLKQQTIYEAQIKALKNILSKKATDSQSKSYLLHLLKLLIQGLHKGKLTPEGKQKVILAQNTDGEIIVSALPNQLKEKFTGKNPKKNSTENKKLQAKKVKNRISAISKKNKFNSSSNLKIENKEDSKLCFFKQYGSLNVGELSVKFNVSPYILLRILQQNEKGETELLTEEEFKKLSPLISSRLETIKRKEKAEKRITTPRIKKPLYRPSNSDSVFGEIYKCGGLGKVIYTGMKG